VPLRRAAGRTRSAGARLSDPAAIAALLAAKAAEIDAEIAGITTPIESGASIQFGKRAGDSTAVAAEQLSRVSAHEQMLVVASEVARAREKVAEGTYGVCDVCGGPVGSERLEALPWAARCVSCASPHRAPRRR
jgi:RNA polymerase-binding transcription factor DksA